MANQESIKSKIILIGFMGSGKTVIGRQTARLLDFDFVDTDEEIKDVTGLDLPQLFRRHGEIRFRSEERLVVQKLAQRDRLVVACGGSLPPRRENLDLLRHQGWFCLLYADPDVLQARLGRKHDRLLVEGRPTVERIAKRAEEWQREYAPLTDLVLNSGHLSVDEAAAALAAAYTDYNEAQRQKGI